MHVLHINSEKDISKVDEMIKQGKDIFILVYMEGCGPCNATRPEWAKIESALKDQYAKNDKLVVIDINKDFLSKIKHIGEVDGFPTMKYIGNHGKTVESYENSSVKKKDRSVSSFINWIESKINKMISTTPTSSATHVYNRISKTKKHTIKPNKKSHHKKSHHKKSHHKKSHHKKIHRGGKWTRKYKLSINCNKPKGFSQRQYCKYGRHKN
jgi:thiol-disulfide isomerase/thioredoxin